MLKKYSLFAGLSVLSLTAPGAAFAAEAAADQAASASAQPAGDDSAPAPDAIVVTALKSSQNLQDVPATVQVINPVQLQQANVTSLVNLNRVVPSMQMYISPLGNPSLFLYGMGTPASGTTFEQSVMPMIDGVANGHARALLVGLYDLSDIEVVKGTQAVLGKNASLGAISVVTKKPTDKFELAVNGSYEFRYGSASVDGAVNVPLSDTLKLRIAGLYSDDKGYYQNTYLNQKWPHTSTASGRATLAWTPTSNFKYIVGVQVDDRQTEGTALGANGFNATAGNGVALCALTNSVCNFTPGFTNQEGVTVFGLPGTKTRAVRTIGTGSLDLGPVSLTSVTGYVHYRSTSIVNIGQLPIDLFDARVRERDSQFSQELRINNNGSGPLKVTAGLYYAHDHFSLPLDSRAVSTPVLSPTGAVLFGVTGSVDFGYEQYTNTKSAFAQAYYDLSKVFQLGGGIRYTNEDRSADISNTTITPGVYSNAVKPPFPLTHVSRTANNVDYSVSLKVTPTPRLNFYASYGTGTKSGGFNNQPLPAATFAQFQTNAQYTEEKARTAEIGAKFSLGAMGYINLSAFSVKVKNFQNATTVGPVLIFLSRDQRSRGGTLDTVLRPIEGLDLRAQVTYANTRDTTLDLPLIQAPQWSGIIGFDYAQVVGKLRVGGGADVSFRSSYWARQPSSVPTATELNYLFPPVQRLNARVTIADPDNRWSVSLVGRNLADKYIPEVSYGATGYTGAGIGAERPRTVTLQFTYHM